MVVNAHGGDHRTVQQHRLPPAVAFARQAVIPIKLLLGDSPGIAVRRFQSVESGQPCIAHRMGDDEQIGGGKIAEVEAGGLQHGASLAPLGGGVR